MKGEIFMKFYVSASGKQNMWIEKCGEEGKRYEVNNEEEIHSILQNYSSRNM